MPLPPLAEGIKKWATTEQVGFSELKKIQSYSIHSLWREVRLVKAGQRAAQPAEPSMFQLFEDDNTTKPQVRIVTIEHKVHSRKLV